MRTVPVVRQGNVATPLAVTQVSPVEWEPEGTQAMSTLNLQSVVYHEGEHFVAQCLNVDVSSFGDTEAEAVANLQEAVELYYA